LSDEGETRESAARVRFFKCGVSRRGGVLKSETSPARGLLRAPRKCGWAPRLSSPGGVLVVISSGVRS